MPRKLCAYIEQWDVIEKGFLCLKRSLDLGRLRVHSQESIQNKVFIGFIALIMLPEINSIMSDKGICSKMGMKQLIKALGKHRVDEIILRPHKIVPTAYPG
jgi:transposase